MEQWLSRTSISESISMGKSSSIGGFFSFSNAIILHLNLSAVAAHGTILHRSAHVPVLAEFSEDSDTRLCILRHGARRDVMLLL
jgi:hypothetical protein